MLSLLPPPPKLKSQQAPPRKWRRGESRRIVDLPHSEPVHAELVDDESDDDERNDDNFDLLVLFFGPQVFKSMSLTWELLWVSEEGLRLGKEADIKANDS